MKITVKHILLILSCILIVGILSTLGILAHQNKKLSEQLEVAANNEKAYMHQNSSLKEENRVFMLTVESLEYSQDSLVQKLNAVRKDLKIKDKEVQSLQYLNSTIEKTDTLILTDTIFKETFVSFDTLISDEWHSQHLLLEYPNRVEITPTFKSEKYIIVNSNKETIQPPKKCWLGRLFQKKHTVLEVNVVEKNPYIETNSNKFIQILK